MEYDRIRLAGWFSLILSAVSVLGAAVLVFGPSASSGIGFSLLMVCFTAFLLVGTVATGVVGILEAQADQIADLQRQLSERRSG